jgi:GNAT superfamily N-acetyltransferase
MSDEPKFRRANSWEEVDRAAVVTARAFDARPNRAVEPGHFRARMLEVPGLSLDNVLLGFVDGQLVCGLQLYDRWTTINGYRLPVAGVGNVMTDPDHQGQGHATRLLGYAIEVIEDKGYPVSLLRGNRSLYARQGWKRLHATRTAVSQPRRTAPAGAVDHADHGFTPYDHGRLEELVAVHRSTCRRTS